MEPPDLSPQQHHLQLLKTEVKAAEGEGLAEHLQGQTHLWVRSVGSRRQAGLKIMDSFTVT